MCMHACVFVLGGGVSLCSCFLNYKVREEVVVADTSSYQDTGGGDFSFTDSVKPPKFSQMSKRFPSA